MNSKIEQARKEHQSAAENLMVVIKKQYPVGTIIDVKLGGHILEIEVTGYSQSWWHSPGYIRGTNINTLNSRDFHVSYIVEEE